MTELRDENINKLVKLIEEVQEGYLFRAPEEEIAEAILKAGYVLPQELKLLSEKIIRKELKKTYSRGMVGFTEEQIEYMVNQESLINERCIAQAQLDYCNEQRKDW